MTLFKKIKIKKIQKFIRSNGSDKHYRDFILCSALDLWGTDHVCGTRHIHRLHTYISGLDVMLWTQMRDGRTEWTKRRLYMLPNFFQGV